MKDHLYCGLAIFLAVGCVDVDTQPVEKAADSLEKAAQSIEDGLTELSQLDPVGINELLERDESLRARLAVATTQLNGYANPSASVVLEGQRVQFEIVDFKGGFRFDGWIDDRDNWFAEDVRLTSVDFALDTSGFRNKIETFAQNNLVCHIQPETLSVDGCHQNFNEFRDEHIIPQFERYAAGVPQPAMEIGPTDLNQSFLTAGLHRIGVDLTPLAADELGNWSFRGRFVALQPNGEKLVLKVFDVDNDKYNEHPLNEPLPTIEALISVQSRTSSSPVD